MGLKKSSIFKARKNKNDNKSEKDLKKNFDNVTY